MVHQTKIFENGFLITAIPINDIKQQNVLIKNKESYKNIFIHIKFNAS